MAQITINVGTVANDGTGDTLRGAFQNVNSNFTELYSNVAAIAGMDLSQFREANAAYTTANAAFNKANTLSVSSNAWANTFATAVGAAGNNYTNYVGASVNAYATVMDAASNNWANTVGTAGNNYASILVANTATASNSWANTVGTSGNTYAGYMANSVNSYATSMDAASNSWANTVGTSANSFAVLTIRERQINPQTTSTYAIALSDCGKVVVANSSTIFVPNSVFYSGNTIFLYNNTASSILITPNSNVLLSYSANSFGSRTLSANGYAELTCIFGKATSQNVFALLGSGIT